MHSTVTNTSRITIQTAGRYLVCCNVYYAANATGTRFVDVLKNGTTAPAGSGLRISTASSGTANLFFASTLVLVVGDYIECRVHQNSGGALNCNLVEFTALYLTR
jgi:hypothetical protein